MTEANFYALQTYLGKIEIKNQGSHRHIDLWDTQRVHMGTLMMRNDREDLNSQARELARSFFEESPTFHLHVHQDQPCISKVKEPVRKDPITGEPVPAPPQPNQFINDNGFIYYLSELEAWVNKPDCPEHGQGEETP